MLIFATLGLTMMSPSAHAGRCDTYLRQADSASGSRLVSTFSSLASCDAAMADEHYHQRFLKRATDTDTLVDLTMAAIEADIWNPAWQQLSKVTSYDARDEIAERVGAACETTPKVITFLQGAYLGIRSDIDFRQWDDAYVACTSEDLTTWLTSKVEAPPSTVFDERYDALLSVYTERQGPEALPALSRAAITAADAGPYDTILMQMDTAVKPEFGASMTTENRQALETALVDVAKQVTPAKARAVADRLANAGSEDVAVQLLPTIYRDRVQGGGSFLYGAVAIETGECKGEKQAVLHLSEVHEPGKRWFVQPDVEAPIRAMKPRLSKCSPDGGDWVVILTSEPVSNTRELSKWSDELVLQWSQKGYATKIQNEKAIKLP